MKNLKPESILMAQETAENYDAADEKVRHDTRFFGQPMGLATLFGLEMWERFSYLGFQAILVLFFADAVANGGLGYDKSTASSVVAAYGTLLYLLTVAGGWLADRMFGTYRSVLYGAIIIACGHYAMALPFQASTWIGLGLIIIGTGLLKPNVSTMVGKLYRTNDERRDAGFAIYYTGINIGAFFGQFVVGWLGQSVNWHLGFSAAAVGMTLGIIQYVLTRKNLAGRRQGAPARMAPDVRRRAWTRLGLGTAAVVIIGVVLALTDVLTLGIGVDVISIASMIAPVLFFAVMFRSPLVSTDERRRLKPYIVLFLGSVIFNLILFQSGNVLNFLALDHAQNMLFGWQFPTTWYASFMPVIEVLSGPLIAALWLKLGHRQPHSSQKVAYGVILGGLSFVLLIFGTLGREGDWRMAAGWLIGVYLLIGVGDVLLETAGLSATTKLAPKAFASQTMALWFLSLALAQGIQAQVVKFYDRIDTPVYFGVIGIFAVGFGVLMLIIQPWMRRLMHPVI